MNGAILGMTRNEVTSRLKEIIEFSGVERHIETPLKDTVRNVYTACVFDRCPPGDRYLILDEVLSVGDVEFQQSA